MNSKSLAVIVACGALLCTLPAAALTGDTMQPSQQSAPASDTKMASDLDTIVCRYQPPPTGTRTGGFRECRSQRFWNGVSNYFRGAQLYGVH
jgi:hypothetical protein